MRLSVFFTPLGVTQSCVAEKPVVIVDILRATTMIVAALANGAKAVLPAATAEDALRIAQNLERDDVLLAGERRAERIPGFALGNSPLEMTREAVQDKTLVMATTNGTPAVLAAAAGSPVFIGSATNYTAAASAARAAFEQSGELIILCAGRERMFSLEDACAAGRFARAVLGPASSTRRSVALNDGAIAALELVRRYGERWKRAIEASAAARELQELGFKDDVVAATESDRFDLVPTYADRLVTARGSG